jgi:hypothetical protein
MGAGSAGAAVVAATPAVAVVAASEEPATKTTSGYRETQHIRDYYRSAKI